MSFPLTIPVSMPHHYVSSHYYGNVSPSYQVVSGQPVGQVPSTVAPSEIMMPPASTMDTRSLSLQDGTSPLVLAMSERTMPVRKQSVFVAPTGLSSLRPPSSRPSTSVSYVLTPPSPPSPSASHPYQPSPSYLTSSASMENLRTEWNSLGHPLDLSESSSPSSLHPVIQVLSGSRLAAPSKEDISQHISQIILKNKALMESFEPFFSHSRHQASPPTYSKRSMSTTQLPSSQGQPLVQSVITSSARASLASHYSFGAYQSPFDPQSASIRRYSSDVNPNVSAYSKLQSALLGEGKSTAEVANLPTLKAHPGRKYSEVPYQPQLHPESFKYPSQLNQAYLHSSKGAKLHKHSVILNAHDHLMEVFPLNESSRSSSEPSLVRNLLTSKTSPFAHLVPSEFVPNMSSTSSTNSNGNSDGSIIKDLLLKSRTFTHEAPPPIFSRSTPPPHKKSRTESGSGSAFEASCNHGRLSNSNLVFTCTLCNVPFRNRQNLEVHQKFYCRGSDTSSHKHNHNSDSMQTSGKRSHQESGPMLIPERKVSVLERPSIITYSNDSPLSSSLSTLSLASTSSGSSQQSQQAQQATSFGNILKSKLLSPGSEDHSSNHFSTPLKKRKISEPAYRYNYDSKHRDSYAKWHRVSVVQPPVLNRSERTSDLEMLPAYMPYLQTPATKITIKSPVLFPVLQNLIDTCTNHEFVVDDTYADSFPSPNLEEDKIDESEIEYLFESSSSHRMSDVGLLVKANQQSLVNEEASLEAQVRETINHLLDEVELSAHDTNQVATDLADVILLASPQASDLHSEVSQCVSDLIDSVANKDQQDQAECATLAETVPEKKISLARPTTLDLATRSYNQSARNEHELGTSVEHIRKISRLSIFVNRCSNQDEDESKLNQLIASTLVSPDTPRAKRKYQQLHINGNAYTNLGLKVTTRPTYCCIFRPQPMFVTQDSNPQLSMYSQWKNHPVPSGDVLELVRTPHDLMSAYDSQEAVFAVSRYRLSLVEVATAATMGGLEIDLGQDEEKEGESKPSGIVTREFLDKVSSRLTNYMSTNVLKLDGSAQSLPPFAHRNFERYLRALVISLGDGFSVRLADTYTRSQFILTHSSHHRLSQLNRNQQLLQQRIRKRSRSQNIDFYKAPIGALKPEMGIASNAVSSSIPYLSQSEQASRLPITESSSLKLPELANWLKPRKRSSTSLSATSLSSSTFSPFLTMHPMLGHLPAKSKQTVMYIMMMSQAPMSMAVPTVSSMISSKNLASRKFSECIGMKPTAIEENWAARIAADGSTEIIPKRIKIFEGGFKSNEDYTYVRGRGRGKYVCEECGIRCKKPSMLKKHIRTHTDLRPYSCRHCAFAFKTKGNLTKHMKSKAHHKKCVELGIIPVPTAIDDSQIDSDALAKQEQYELSCGSSGSFNQFADDDDDCDDDYDEEEFEDEDEEDDEGVPIPLIEQQRLTYIVPGQFDDAELDPTNENQKTTSHKSSDCSSTLSATSFSPRPKLSIGAVASAACNTVSSLSSTTSNLPLSIADIRAEQNDKSRKMSSSSTLSPLPMLSSMSNKMISSSKSDIGLIATTPNQQQTCAQSYHFAQDQLTTNSTSNMRQNITKEHEAEAARSLLILSGAAHNSELANSTTATAVSSHLTKSNVLSGDSENVLQSVYRSSISRKNSNLVDFNPGNQLPSERVDKTAISESEASLRPDRIIYEMASDRVLLAQNHLYPNESEQHRLTTDSRQSPVEMFRRTSQKVDRRTSQPTSVIISRSSPIECIEEEDRRKRIRHERSISESSNSSLQMHSLGPDGSLSVSPKSHNLLSISSLITSPTSSYVNTSPMPSFPLNPTSSAQLLQHQYALGVRNPRAAFIAEEIKRAIANSNESVIQQSPLMSNTSARMVPNSHSPPMMTYQRDNRQSPIPPSTNGGSVSALDNAALMQQQKLMHKIYENLKQSSPQLKSFQGNVNQYVLANAELSDQRVHLTDPSKSHSGLSLSSQIANNNLKMPISSQPIPTMNYLVPTTSVDAMKLAFNAYEKDSNKSRLAFQSMSERNVSQMTPSVARHFASSGNSLSSSSQHFSSSSNVPLPPPPSSPLPAPVSFDPSTVSKRSQSESDESDQPIDLSKTSVLSVSEPNIAKEAQEPTLKANNLSPVGHSSLELSPISPTQLAQNSPNRHRFRPLIEEKHLTEQLVRAFSPFSEMHSISFPKSPNQSHSNGREMYKNVRSEEFAHLAPGVHTPHRLPQNMLLLGARNNSSSLPVTSAATLSGASLTRNPNSIPNAYTTAEGKSVCTICMKQFSKPSQLRLHINIHFFERPFRCDSCAVSFRTKGHLQKHSRSVSHLNKLNMNITFGRPSTDNPRPFKCSDCKIAFRIHGHLAKHLRSKMHIMKLECLGKLPFGMFAEMERSNINLTPIDTTDCEKALESLRSLAQKLYDPRQMCWKVTDAIGQGMDDVIEEDIDDDIDGEDVDDYNDDDIDMSDAAHQLIASSDDSSKSLEENSPKESIQIGLVSQESTEVISAVPNIVLSSSPPPTGSTLSTSSTSLSGSIASTRSNTCHLCGRLFKAAKFLQVHLYCDHPEAESTEAVVSSV